MRRTFPSISVLFAPSEMLTLETYQHMVSNSRIFFILMIYDNSLIFDTLHNLDLVAFVFTEFIAEANIFETRCVSLRVQNGIQHWYRTTRSSNVELEGEELYECFSKSFLFAYKQRCF